MSTPEQWIVQLFNREKSEGRTGGETFPTGAVFKHLPLQKGEKVYGVFQDRYYFSPEALFIVNSDGVERVDWRNVRHCSTTHGCGQAHSMLAMTDGREIKVRLSDFGPGWSGRISQLYHIMIERLASPAFGKSLVPFKEFFAAGHAKKMAPNLMEHPGNLAFAEALRELESSLGDVSIYIEVAEDDDQSGVGIVAVGPHAAEAFEPFAKRFGADGVARASDEIVRKLGQVPAGSSMWHIAWD